MTQIATIFAWIAAGLALRRAGVAARAFVLCNRFIIWVSLPATVLLALHALRWDPSYWVAVSMAWLVFAGSVAFFSAVGRRLGWSPRTVGALALTGGLGNTSFLGFPLVRALYGEGALATAVMTDQPGSFLVLSTAGLAAASYFSSGRTSAAAVVRKMASFPPMWALIAGLALRPVAFPGALTGVLRELSRTLVPLALISVGAALKFDRARLAREKAPVAAGLLYKLILAPLGMALFLAVVGHRHGEIVRVTLVEAAMGPMITGAIVAEEYGLDAELCSLMVGAGVPLCLLTVPLWAKILEWMGV